MPLKRERWAVKSLVETDRQQMLGLAGLALAGVIAPMVLKPWLPLPLRTLSLLMGTAASAGLAAVSYQSATKERKEESDRLHRIQTASYTHSLAHQVTQQNMLTDLLAKQQVVNMLQRLPVQQRIFYGQQYGVYNLLRFPELEQQGQPPAMPVQPPIAVAMGQNADEMIPPQEEPDTSWMNPDFWMQSKTILGVKGTGKSLLMKNEAAQFKQIAPNGILWINDPHFDEDPEPEQAQEQWLRPIPVEVLQRDYIKVSVSDQLSRWRQFRRVMRDRVSKKDKVGLRAANQLKKQPQTTEPVIKLIQDEFIGFVSKLSPDDVKEVVSIIEECEYEWRKYGGTISLGLHSLKNKQNGLDSSIYLSMIFVALGSSLADTNTRWSAEFNVSELLKDQEALKHGWPKHYNCVVRFPGESANAQVMPFLDWPMLTLNDTGNSAQTVPQTSLPESTEDIDPIEGLKAWLSSFGRMPTDDELLDAWTIFMPNTPLNEKGLLLLKQKLGIDDGDMWD